MIIRGGENIYAAEIEARPVRAPRRVSEAAIVGLPDEKYGEIVGAFVRLHDGATVDADDLRDWVRGRLAAFKVPAVVDIRNEALPRNATGKVLKRELREDATSQGVTSHGGDWLRRRRADVTRRRADDAVVGVLLERVGAPADDAGGGERRREQVAREAAAVHRHRGVPLDVRAQRRGRA